MSEQTVSESRCVECGRVIGAIATYAGGLGPLCGKCVNELFPMPPAPRPHCAHELTIADLTQQVAALTAELSELRKIATLAAIISSHYYPRCAEDSELSKLLTAWREKEQPNGT